MATFRKRSNSWQARIQPRKTQRPHSAIGGIPPRQLIERH